MQLQEGSAVKVLRLYTNSLGEVFNSEYLYGTVKTLNELYSPPALIEITLPHKKGEGMNFYRFWSEVGNITVLANPVVIQDAVNPFGY